ncbi:sensor histidine kinase [Arcobacter sp. YIC-80]|uniref:sensor histidine kinase n=1 Tax=Arcobacter sp. YIC-80 TaxID=3376683 RepID=UPI00384EB17C
MTKRVDYLKQFIYLFILIGTSLSILILAVTFFELEKYNKKESLKSANTEIKAKINDFNKKYQEYNSFLSSIKNNLLFINYLENSNFTNKNNLTFLFTALMSQENDVTQLRYLDINGNEKLRLERKVKNDIINVVYEKKLQNKFHRDYFKEVLSLEKNSVYLSKIDLNIEYNKIEIPYKPVWRFAIPIYLDDIKKGVLIVNFFMQDFLEKLLESSLFDVHIFDQDKYVLVSSKNKNSWSRYLGKNKIDENQEFLIKKELFHNEGKEKIYMAFTLKENTIDFYKYLNTELIFLIFLIIIIAFFLAKVLSNIPKKLFDKIELQQKLLIQQSKHSAMGEMTSMLAHQWRQPLNIISSLIQEIEIKKEMKILKDEEFFKNTKEIKNTLTHMSLTINDFSDFFKPNKLKNKFYIDKAIQESIKLIEKRLEKYNIKCKVSLYKVKNDSDLLIKSFENEFKNVVVNLLNNSIDAFSLKSIDNKLIQINIFSNKKEIKIDFIDNAGGINENISNSLFEPYVTTKEDLNGSGLGLYMSKIIIEQNMKGSIIAKNIGKKAVFSLVLEK